MIGRFPLKKMLILIAAFSSLSWLMIGTIVYLVKGLDPLLIDLLGGVAEACVATMTILLGYEFVSRLSTLNTRPTVFVIFNSVTYGIGGIIFVQINAFLSKTVVFGAEGFLVWLVMSIAVAVSLVIVAIFFREQDYLTAKLTNTFLISKPLSRGEGSYDHSLRMNSRPMLGLPKSYASLGFKLGKN
ncbi:hypothetical protein [Mycoplasma sp. ATU-Cv-508]|uniref:hypothetical protein n=1 Tax=Mycoplasma sp. ATU-Cv-508 TaxID=2048001 RepID=UPI0013750C6D